MIQPTDEALNPSSTEDSLPLGAPPCDISHQNDEQEDSFSSYSSILQSKKRKITAAEWLETVLKVTDQLRWTEMYYDDGMETENSAARVNPLANLLTRDCPVETPESGVALEAFPGEVRCKCCTSPTPPPPLLVSLDDEISNKE